MKKIISGFCILLASALLAGCGMLSPQAASATPTYPPPITTEPVTPTHTPLPSATPTPHPTPTPYQPISGSILFDAMRLRRGPGFLFETVRQYPVDQTISLLGRAPGNNWFYAQTTDGFTGWMKMEGIELDGNFYDAPEVTPDRVVIIRGRVFGTNGSPASDLSLMIQPKGDDTTSMQDVGRTDVTGRFYIYLPEGTRGEWTLALAAYGCESSAVDRNCSLIGKFPEPSLITLPDASEAELELHLLPLN